MSVTLAAVAEALIEFILSLLRDPDAMAEFEAEPDAVLNARGLGNVTASDVAAVVPVIVERPFIVPRPEVHLYGPSHASSPVVREIENVVNNLSLIDDRDTIVDQSVNQNIWADGDVTQVFDQEATVASGDDAIAAGDDVAIQQVQDNSTTITAGDDAVVANETTETVTENSNNQTTDASTTTDSSTQAVVTESFTEAPATQTAEESYNTSATEYTEATVETESTTVFESTDTTVVEDTSADGDF